MLRLIPLLLTVGLLAGCQSGVTQTPGTPPATEFDGQDQVLEALPRTPSDTAEVSGRILIDGLTLVGGDTSAGPAGPPSMLAKIINPGDDILSAVEVLPGNTFRITHDREVRAIFELELRVAEDLDGDGETPDVLIQRVPVHLRLGRMATVNLTLRLGRIAPPGSDTAGTADSVFFPAEGEGELVLVTAEIADAAGAKTVFMARRPDGSLAFDSNGNSFIEPGDRVYSDSTLTGWPDTSELAYAHDAAASFKLEGVVAAVDVALRRLTVRTATREDIELVVDPFAALQTMSAEGDVLGQLVLDPSLVGRRVEVGGLRVGTARHAGLILIRAER